MMPLSGVTLCKPALGIDLPRVVARLDGHIAGCACGQRIVAAAIGTFLSHIAILASICG
jgi:hypothetical protein